MGASQLDISHDLVTSWIPAFAGMTGWERGLTVHGERASHGEVGKAESLNNSAYPGPNAHQRPWGWMLLRPSVNN